MKLTLLTCLSASVLGLTALTMTPSTAKADEMISAMQHKQCMTVNNNKIFTFSCGRGDSQNWFTAAYGPQTYHGMCLDMSAPGQGSQLVVGACNGGPNQRWGIQPTGELRNEAGWVADVQGGSAAEGTPVIIWHANGGVNQKWGQVRPAGAVSPAVMSKLAAMPNAVVTPAGLVASGAGNLVASGAGNLVASGAGNLVASGAGNVMVHVGGMLVSY